MSWWGKWRREDASHRVLYAIITLTVVIFAAFFLIGFDHPFSENPDFIEPRLTTVLLVFMLLVVLLAVGVTTQVALQVFLNIAVVTNLVPNTGISLPFFSYGGTALAIQLAEMGVVLSVSRQMPPS